MTLSSQEGDRIFERLTEVSETLGPQDLAPFLARLVFLLANEIGDAGPVLSAIEAAQR